MKFSPHFSTETDPMIEVSGDPIPVSCLPMARKFFSTVMEGIRLWVAKPVIITSGYRGVEHNKNVNGAADSQHIWSPEHCAVDFTVSGIKLVFIYDWIRLKSRLQGIDQLILERGRQERHENDDCIHISMSMSPRYMALEGQTHNAGDYLIRPFVRPEDVEWS